MNVKETIKKLTLSEKAALCAGLDFWHLRGIERLGIPSLMVCDGPNGLRKQAGPSDHMGVNQSVPAVCFPTSSALAASFDRGLLSKIGETLGKECQAEGVSVLLGPGVNIKRTPLCGRNFEYYSEDPYLSSELASSYIKGVQSQGVGTSIKHFAANNQEYRRMTTESVVDERTLHEIYLASFEGAVKKAHPKTVMCSYNRINGVYSAENKELLTAILRNQWKYGGTVVTDWGAVKDRVQGIIAGLDLEMPGPAEANGLKIISAVQTGKLDEKKLDECVERILNLIDDCANSKRKNVAFDYAGDHDVSREAETQCAVLLKNDRHVLPIAKNTRVALIGEFASEPRFQGHGSSFINCKKITSACDAVSGMKNVTFSKGYLSKNEATDTTLLSEAIKRAREADAAVIFAGLPEAFESEGFDRKNLSMPVNQNRLIEEVCKAQPNTVVVLHNGAPVEMPWISEVPAVLEMYLGGEAVGAAAIELIFGDVNPSGKLAETFPKKLEHTPSYLNYPGFRNSVCYAEGVYVGYRYYDKKTLDVLFPFGHGLSYTEFVYSALQFSRTEITDQEMTTVTVKVKNTGKCAGREVVQLYVCPLESSIDRPVRELKGFEKIELKPGEEKTVSFTLDRHSFAYYDTQIHDWHVESGRFAVDIGSSSRDIRQSGILEVRSTVQIPATFTQYSTVGEIMASEKARNAFTRLMRNNSEAEGEPSVSGQNAITPEMIAAMMKDMPLISLATFGILQEEQIPAILSELNG